MSLNRTLGAPYETALALASFTTEHNVDAYLVDATVGNPVVVTLDPGAAPNDRVLIQDLGGNADVQPIVIQPSPGQMVPGGSLQINTAGGAVQLVFIVMQGTGIWLPQILGGGAGVAPSSGGIADSQVPGPPDTPAPIAQTPSPPGIIMGCSVTLTPQLTGKLRVIVTGSFNNNSSSPGTVLLGVAAGTSPPGFDYPSAPQTISVDTGQLISTSLVMRYGGGGDFPLARPVGVPVTINAMALNLVGPPSNVVYYTGAVQIDVEELSS
jgi:hypothetical protein